MEDTRAICQGCGLPFSVECAVTTYELAGQDFARIPLGSESAEWWLGQQPATECHDCGARSGQRHHVFCDMEQCPRCGNQAFTCDCPD